VVVTTVDDDGICEDGCDQNAPHGRNEEWEMDVDDNDPAP
jgi:hypothetical protein